MMGHGKHDVLHASLRILTALGYSDPRMNETAALVESKRNDKGKWILEQTYNGRFLFNIERKWKPSKWVTLRALTALTEYFS
jgi:phosphate-selective porin